MNTMIPTNTKYFAKNHPEMYHFKQKRKTSVSVGDERLLYYKNRKRIKIVNVHLFQLVLYK